MFYGRAAGRREYLSVYIAYIVLYVSYRNWFLMVIRARMQMYSKPFVCRNATEGLAVLELSGGRSIGRHRNVSRKYFVSFLDAVFFFKFFFILSPKLWKYCRRVNIHFFYPAHMRHQYDRVYCFRINVIFDLSKNVSKTRHTIVFSVKT